MTVALMWEAKAASGRGPDLLAWARAQEPAPTPGPGSGGAPGSGAGAGQGAGPLRRETYRAPGDRVLVITWWDAPHDAELPELPDPAPELTARPVHRWRFEQV